MKENEWRNDAEYMSYVGNLLVKPKFKNYLNMNSIIFARDLIM